MSDLDPPRVTRRTVLGGIAGLGALSVLPAASATAGPENYEGPHADHADSHHPGHPRFVTVGERVQNPVHVGQFGAFGTRDNLAPRLPSFDADPENYDAGDFSWSLVERPDDSDAEVTPPTSVTEQAPRYDSGRHNTAEFVADVPGRYVLGLDAPDGTHEWTFHAFPAGDGPRPRLTLDATFDEAVGEFVVEADPALPPGSESSPADVETVFLVDDRDALGEDDVAVDGLTARVPVEALEGESGRLHAACHDGTNRSTADVVELSPDGAVDLPNRPPEWAKEGVMYEIFPRSWAGERGATTMADLTDGVAYLDDLGVDWVWLTPTVPSESAQRQLGGELLPGAYGHLVGTLSGGGPHGYDTLDYFGVAPDLVPDGVDPLEAYRQFVEECHDHDIRVVFDLVANHSGRSHEFFQSTIADQGTDPPHPDLEYPPVESWATDAKEFDWYARVDAEDTYQGTFVEGRPYATGFFGLRHMPNWNYDNLAARAHMLAVADFWSGQVGVDGFRCDVAWGVPKSLWREVREVVRDNDSEFLMLDETIPTDPTMAENAFDMHFDTLGFTHTAHDVAAGSGDPGQLVKAVRDRTTLGVPDHSLVLNLTENHDEHRLLNQAAVDPADPDRGAVSDEEWDLAARRQRVCWATGVCLPGVPGIYYGQERQISRYGEGRHMGADDSRGRADGGVNTGADVRPAGRQRAFMNWDEYPEDHLAFYRTVVDAYSDLDVLGPDAALRDAWHFSPGDVLSFGRDASDLDGVDGPERVAVLANFGPDPVEVAVRPELGNEDLLSGTTFEDENPDLSGTWFDLEDIAVLATPELFSTGPRVAAFEPPEGTDYGPGTYEYPTGEEYVDGVFDLTRFSVHETGETVQFHAGVAGDLANPRDLDGGMSLPFLQVYVRDPGADGGSTEAREGVNATFEAPYQYRVLADGDNGVRVETDAGDLVAEGDLTVNGVVDEFVVEFPADAIDAGVREAEISPLLLGYDASAPGGVRPVEAEAGESVFGGAGAETAPNVVDTGLPSTFPNEETLAYTAEERAEVPFAAVVTEFESVASFDLETGTGYGPGDYEVPTGDAYYEAAWDIDAFAVAESRDDVRFVYTMAAEPRNPWDLPGGFAHQFFQLYLYVPHSDGPTSTQGREGTNVAFEAPYHYRVVVHGEGVTRVEDAEGSVVTDDVEVDIEGSTFTIELPRGAVEWETEESGVGVAATVMPYDGFGTGGIRLIAPEADTHTIGGGADHGNDPAVMDMVTPEGVDRQSVLSDYDADTPAELPMVFLGDVDPDEAVADDEEGDATDEDEGDGDGTSEDDGETTDESDGDGDGTGESDGDGTGGEGTTDTPGDGEDGDSGGTEADGTGTTSGSGPGFGVTGALAGATYAAKRFADRAGTEESEE